MEGKWTRRHRANTIGESETDTPAHGESSSAGLPRQSDDQADFGATQVGPGSLALPPVDPNLLLSVPATLLGTPVDATDGENIVSVDFPKLKHQAVGPGYGKGPARSMLDNIYLNCANSSPSPGKRNWDEYGLPVPQLSTQETPGVAKSFDSADVWRCYVRNFTD